MCLTFNKFVANQVAGHEIIEKTRYYYQKIADVGTPFPDAYNSQAVEEGWYDWWKENGYFAPSIKSGDSIKNKDSSKTFSIILPPPNVTGQLHLGHALTATIQDALVRW